MQGEAQEGVSCNGREDGRQMKERVAIYARVSTDDQAERNTIELQIIACRDYCKAEEYEVVEEFKDDGVSGAMPFAERPEGKRLLEVAEAKLFDRVVIYCVDRLSRDTLEALLAMREFERLGISIDFALQPFDDTPESKFQFEILTCVASLERRYIARRTSVGRRSKVKQGAYMCNQIPYGYRRDGMNLKPHAWEAEIIRRIFAWCIAGDGLQGICNRLRGLHIQPPSNGPKPARQWHVASIHRFLTSRRYAGEAHYGDLSMGCPAIVDRATFDAAQAALKARKAFSGPRPKHPYLLKGRVFCRICGHLFYVDTSSKGKAMYRCGGVKKHHTVPSHEGTKIRWLAAELEGRVRAWATAIVNDPKYLLESAEAFEWIADHPHSGGQEEAWLQAQVDRSTAERQRLIDLRLDGSITHDETTTRLSHIEAERSKAMARLRAMRDQPTSGELYRGFAQFLRDCAAGRDTHGEAAWDDVSRLVQRVWVEPDGELTIEGNLSLPTGG